MVIPVVDDGVDENHDADGAPEISKVLRFFRMIQALNLKVVGSNPTPATKSSNNIN